MLLYCYPVQLIYEDQYASGVVLAIRCGEQTVWGSAIVDATEEGVLWRQTGIETSVPDRVPGRYSFFMDHAHDGLSLPLELGEGVVVWASVWEGEVRVDYRVDDASALVARRALPEVIRRAHVPQLGEALVSHVANEPLPLSPLVQFGQAAIAHPTMRNLFGCGVWASDGDGTPAGRMALGEEVGKAAAQCEGPYRCLLPRNVDGLLLASRALSMTYDAHHAFRVQNDIQRIGEVVALAAVQAVRSGVLPRVVDVGELRPILKERGLLAERYRPKPAIVGSGVPQLPDPAALSGQEAKSLVWLGVRAGPQGSAQGQGSLRRL